MTTDPLTEAEQAVYAEVYAGAHNTGHSMVGLKPGFACSRCEATARAVVAAVRSQIEADVLDALADVADAWEPPSAAHLRTLAFMVRKGLSTVADLRAEALSRPTSEETHE